MANVFAVSDHHFGHANILKFTKNDEGELLRPGFADVEEMNEFMIEKHNSVVRPNDKVYFGGDIAMNPNFVKLVERMNGHKRLILGNHDHGKVKLYTPYFEAFYSSRLLDRMLFTHIPVHPSSIGKSIANVHGHTHGQHKFGPKYFDVSVEAINYTPISLEEIKKRVLKQLEEASVQST